MDIIKKYFPEITPQQEEQFARLYELYGDWNRKINVISRKDIDNLYERHVLHSLAIARFLPFRPGTSLLDVGTGGGFPGIPLAILLPECRFTLIDSIGKKIRVASEVAQAIGLKNAKVVHRNAVEEKGKYDFVVSRAVMRTNELIQLIRKNITPISNNERPNGLICLKGGDLNEELSYISNPHQVIDLTDYFEEDFFETKKIVYVQLNKNH